MMVRKKGGHLKEILKWPLIVAALVVVLRVVVERAGVPNSVANLLSIAALITVLGPLYFAVRVSRTNTDRPFAMLVKLILIYAVCARAMVLPTYWLARIYNWPQSRFAGLAGPNVTPFVGFVTVPVITGLFWIVASLVIGSAVGGITLAMARSRTKTA